MRLATKDEFVRLCKCYTRFDESLHGRWFFDKETGEELFFPCEGYRDGATVNFVGTYGYYWSSTYNSSYSIYYFHFGSSYAEPSNSSNSTYNRNGHSVRLVSNEPFEGAVHVAGLYWKPVNEEGYYTWEEVAKFND